MLFIVSEVELIEAGGDGPPRFVASRRADRRQVRALLAVRAGGVRASRTRRALRPLRRGALPGPSHRDHGARSAARSVPAIRVAARRARRRRSISSTKALVVRRARRCTRACRSIPGLLDLTHVRNTGAAFGFLNAVDFPFKTVVIAVVALAALVGVALYARSCRATHWLAAARAGADHRRRRRQPDRPRCGRATSSISSTSTGATGTSGRSTSPTAAITVGVALMILDMLRRHAGAAD